MTGRAGALIDVDGTLVDTNYFHTIAWIRALRAHGENAMMAAIHRCIGMGGGELLKEVIGHSDDAIKAAWKDEFLPFAPELQAFPRAGDLLRALQSRGFVVVLATSSPQDLLDLLRQRLDADDAVDTVVNADDVEQAKPEPDIFRAALDKADVDPGLSVALGDSVWDIEAAGKAGVRCVAVESGGYSEAELRDAGAVAVYRDPADLLAHLDESPFGTVAAKADDRG
jgi:HAD superfamily hydrolase (TIGR01509 family)